MVDETAIILPATRFETYSECPYCEYNADYGMSYDSGYDCRKLGQRIIDDWIWDNTNNRNRLSNHKWITGIPIPNACPYRTKPVIFDKKLSKAIIKARSGKCCRDLYENEIAEGQQDGKC